MKGDTDVLCRVAARACLMQCRQSTMPFTAMADFLDGLREQGWSESSISMVVWIVMRSSGGGDIMSQRHDKPPN